MFDVELDQEGKSPRKLRAKLRDPFGPAQINEASYHRLNVAAEEVKIEVFNFAGSHTVDCTERIHSRRLIDVAPT